MIIPIILSGGSGTRLWPLSRSHYPKQFLNLSNERSLFQDTILRLPKFLDDPLIICNEDQRFLAAEQLREIQVSPNSIILEPVGKNTAPAITLAALKLQTEKEDPLLLVLSADHTIKDLKAFHQAIKYAESLAKNNNLVTFGATPNRIEPGYGYIEIEKKMFNNSHRIKSFKEKPSKEDSRFFLNSGNYLWNSGMFMFKASTYLEEMQMHDPLILEVCKKSMNEELKDIDFIRLNNSEFIKSPNISIDHAIMEKTKKGVVVPIDIGWSDIGTWEALLLEKEKDKDLNGNIIDGDVIIDNVENSYIYGNNRLITASNISNLIIVDTEDALLVANRENSQNVQNLVAKLKNNNRSETKNHKKVFRPWGYYDLIASDIGYQVKRIVVNPRAKLSLQKHRHRSEHWVVLKGEARITLNEKVFNLTHDQSTFIPKGKIHRIENIKDIPLEIIEIQTGNYLGEDDIIRLEDDYQRS